MMSALPLKADMCSAKRHVRFTRNSDRKSGYQSRVMSALPPKADMCGATRDVRFGPIADIPCLVDFCDAAALADSWGLPTYHSRGLARRRFPFHPMVYFEPAIVRDRSQWWV